jgi:hypothetical protein
MPTVLCIFQCHTAYRKELTDAEPQSETHLMHLNGLEQYEESLNNSDKGYVRHVDLPAGGAPTTARAQESRAFRGTTNHGVFWPKELYEATTKCKLNEDASFVYMGRPGIVRGDQFGCPVGCTKLESITETKALKDTEVRRTPRVRLVWGLIG